MEIGLYSNQMIYRRGIDARTQDHQSPAPDVIANENAGRKTSSSSHLSKVETVLSKCLSEIICRRRRTHGIPDNLSRSNYPTLTPSPSYIDPRRFRWLATSRGAVHFQSSSDFGRSISSRPCRKYAFSRRTFLLTLRIDSFFTSLLFPFFFKMSRNMEQ